MAVPVVDLAKKTTNQEVIKNTLLENALNSILATTMQKRQYTRKYSSIIITLDNVFVPEQKLEVTPSMEDGLEKNFETDIRILGCELIQSAGILLKLPQVAMATAQVIFQRFYYEKSFVRHPMDIVAMACLVLASKVEESPRRNRDIINVFHHMKQRRKRSEISPLVLDQNYIILKNQVIKAERRLLKELGFCIHVKHPHKIIVMYLQILERERNTKLAQASWNYMNDSLRTDVFMKYSPEVIACACISLAARQLNITLPNNPYWYRLFGAGDEDISNISLTILRLYARPKTNLDSLEQKVNDLRKAQIDAKIKGRGDLGGATPSDNPTTRFSPSTSATNSPAKSENKIVRREKGSSSLGRQSHRNGDGVTNGKIGSSRSPTPHSPPRKKSKDNRRDRSRGGDDDRDRRLDGRRGRGRSRDRSSEERRRSSKSSSSKHKHRRVRSPRSYSRSPSSDSRRRRSEKGRSKDGISTLSSKYPQPITSPSRRHHHHHHHKYRR